MKNIFKLSSVFFVLFLSLFSASNASAASTMTISPASNKVGIGQEFSVTLLMDTAGQKINAAQGIISYSPGVIQMVSIDNSKSIFNFWVEDPTISKDIGTMSFIGGNPNSVSGEKMTILVMKFKAMGIGNSSIKITNAVVSADDGLGTNVLSVTNDASVVVSGTGAVPSTPTTEAPVAQPQKIERIPEIIKNLPSAPVVSVKLYPDNKKWYSQIGETIVFWNLPKDVTSVAVSADNNPNGIPFEFGKELFDGKNIGILNEGISYVHVRFKNNIGLGQISNYKISLDKTSPLDFKIEMVEGLKTDNPTPTITFSTQDNLSGLESYIVIVDRQAPVKTTTGELKLSLLEPGTHSVLVKAFDNAGNSTDSSLSFEILPIASPEIKFVTQPFFSDSDNALLVRGSGLPNTISLISVKKSDGTIATRASIRTDEAGEWEYSFSDTLQNGDYTVFVRSQDDRGALSLPAEYKMVVKSKPVLKIGAFELNLSGVVFLLIVLLALSFFGGYYFYKFKQEKLSNRVFITKQDITKVTDMIKSDLEDLKKAMMTKENFDDKFVLKKLEENISKIDKYIQKQVGNIGK